jgi:purine-binding chemotaxis protein CheW
MSNTMTMGQKRAQRVRSAIDKHLGLLLGSELLVVPILAVQEIVSHQDITPVPRMAPHIRGVINLRGRVLTVIDLRIRLGMEPSAPTKKTCIVVAQVPGSDGLIPMGLLVDQVTEVMDIPKDQIDPPPQVSSHSGQSYLTGIARIGQKVAMVIDLPHLLGPAIEVSSTEIEKAGTGH